MTEELEQDRRQLRRRIDVALQFDGGLVSFSRCRQVWADLAPTASQSVRHCATCAKDVHLVADLGGFEHAIAEGRCIAVPIEDELYCGGEGSEAPYEAGVKLEWD
jgi:hypothetical protein